MRRSDVMSAWSGIRLQAMWAPAPVRRSDAMSAWSGIRLQAMWGPAPVKRLIILFLSSPPPAQVRRSDVMSAWSGIRPLAVDPHAANTAEALRDHIVTTDPDGLITVTGGLPQAGPGKLCTLRTCSTPKVPCRPGSSHALRPSITSPSTPQELSFFAGGKWATYWLMAEDAIEPIAPSTALTSPLPFFLLQAANGPLTG